MPDTEKANVGRELLHLLLHLWRRAGAGPGFQHDHDESGALGMVTNISDANARLGHCPVRVHSTLVPVWLCIIYYGDSDTEARHLDTTSHAEHKTKTPQTGAEGSAWEGNINVPQHYRQRYNALVGRDVTAMTAQTK